MVCESAGCWPVWYGLVPPPPPSCDLDFRNTALFLPFSYFSFFFFFFEPAHNLCCKKVIGEKKKGVLDVIYVRLRIKHVEKSMKLDELRYAKGAINTKI